MITNSIRQTSSVYVDENEQSDIEEKLKTIASKITTIEEWEEYIKKFYEQCCKRCAELEISECKNKSNSKLDRPIAVITAGQPGAGKTPLINMYRKIINEEYGVEPVLNNSDLYRFCVPGSKRITETFPEHASRVTDPVVKKVRQYLIEKSIQSRQSTIIENTLGDVNAVNQIKESGIYDFYITLLAVPREESLLSDFERYIEMKEDCTAARLVSIKAHDDRFFALDNNINKLHRQGIRIIVHSRGKGEKAFPEVIYDSYDSNNKRFRSLQESIDYTRNENFNQGKSEYEIRLKEIRSKLEGFGMTKEEEGELNKLEIIINEVIRNQKEGIDYDD